MEVIDELEIGFFDGSPAVEREFSGREDWLVWRRGGIGSSDATAIALASGLIEHAKASDLDTLRWDKWGLGVEFDSPNMARGRAQEEGIRQWLEDQGRLGLLLPVNLERGYLRASLDGFDPFRGNLYAEIKSSKSPHVLDAAARGEIPQQYIAQVCHQGLVLGRLDAAAIFAAAPATGDGPMDFGKPICVEQPLAPLREFTLELFEAEKVFWRSVLERRMGVAGWYDLGLRLGLAKLAQARRAPAEPEKEEEEKSERAAPAKARTDYKGLIEAANVEPAALEPFTSRTLMVGRVSKGAALADESLLLPYLVMEDAHLEDEVLRLSDEAKALARDAGVESLTGPFGMRVYTRRSVSYAKACKALGLLT